MNQDEVDGEMYMSKITNDFENITSGNFTDILNEYDNMTLSNCTKKKKTIMI